jgi:hypothetical protein
VEGSREAASSSKLLWLQKHTLVVCAWHGARSWRYEQVEEASAPENLGIRLIIGAGPCATAPRGISQLETPVLSECTHASVSSSTHFLARNSTKLCYSTPLPRAFLRSLPSVLDANAPTLDALFWCFWTRNSRIMHGLSCKRQSLHHRIFPASRECSFFIASLPKPNLCSTL